MKKLFFMLFVVVCMGSTLSAQQGSVFMQDADAVESLKEAFTELRSTPYTNQVAADPTKVLPTNGQAFIDAIRHECKLQAVQLMIDAIQDNSNNQATVDAVFQEDFYNLPEVTPDMISDAKSFLIARVTK